MSFSVIQPPKDETAFTDTGKEIHAAAKKFGLNLDVEGFLFAWTSGTRVAVERNAEGEIISLAMVAVGKRWVTSDFTASVLELQGNREGMLEFLKVICNALGATSLFVEEEGTLSDTPGLRRYVVQEIKLQ